MSVRAVALLMLAALACSADSREPSSSSDDRTLLLAEEARYRIVALIVPPTSADSPGELRVTMTASGDWHVEPEAPIRLTLESSSVRIEPTAFTNRDARVLTDDGFEFVAQLHADASGPGHAKGQIKFGICEGPKEQCVIVRRDFDIALRIVFAD